MRNAIGKVRSGPPPDPNALRRGGTKLEQIHLPAAGREGDPPPYPLDRPSEREMAVWNRVWHTPQAAAWDNYVDTVAFYVQAYVLAESPTANTAIRTLVKQYQDTLGLTDAGLRSNRWVIDSEPEQKQTRTDDAHRRSAKARLRSIEGGAA
jgi:hypothetical protein